MRFAAGGNNSRGRWLVKQLPGVALMRHKSGKWKLHVGLAILTPDTESQEKAWGKNWTSRTDRTYMRISGNKYRTRDEALIALEQLGDQHEQSARAAISELFS